MATNQPAPTRALATLTPTVGPRSGHPIPILTPVARIGQGAQSDVVLDDDTVSTNHARLEYVEGAWQLTDLSSKNGTFVNGERIAPGVPIALTDADSVGFGALPLTFTATGGTDADAAARAYAPPATATASASAPGFRLPVWLLLLILIVVGIILAVVFLAGGEPTADPVLQPVAAMIHRMEVPRAA